MTIFLRGGTALAAILLGACALQPDYRKPTLSAPPAWNNMQDGLASAPASSTVSDTWWSELNDPAIDALVSAALADNPTLAEAVARVDQARALLTVNDAGKLPSIGIEGSATRARDRLNPTGGPTHQTSASLGARLSWEIDLWRRVRESANAARYRVGARTADADSARLSVVGDIADNAIALRACILTLEVRDRDIASRDTELRISRARLAFGSIAPVALATAQSNLASARTDRIAQDEACRLLIDALVALSGRDAVTVRDLFVVHPLTVSDAGTVSAGTLPWLPSPPPYRPALPAIMLLGNPGVRAAESELAARWSEIAVARAERMPRIDIAAVFTGQWIRALGSESSFTSNSFGASLSAPLFDGGARAANVRGAQAAYQAALAQFTLVVRTTIRDVEDALAVQQSAFQRQGTSREMLDTAGFALTANEARWRAGAISQFELEESRRQFNRAQQGMIAASADLARAWVALVRRTGPTADQAHALAPNGGERPQ